MTSAAMPDADAALRGAGLRVTDSRLAVFSALRENPHASADQVYAVVAPTLPRANRQSVYNALSDFAAAGLVRRIEPAGGPARYEGRVGDNHHHVVCRSCGVVADVDCAVGDAPCLTASESHGFTIDEAEVVYWGLCPACSPARST